MSTARAPRRRAPLRRATVGVALAIAVIAAPATARAGDPPHKVALAPLATLGVETKSSETRRVSELIRAGIAGVPDVELVSENDMLAAIKRAKAPQLRSCDGEPECLSQLGELVGATYVVYGELGGLGGAQLVSLEVIDVASKRSLRSTTLRLGADVDADKEARAAGFRLLAPSRYTGKLVLAVDVDGATVFLDGVRIKGGGKEPISTTVGTHALRVTHPEYRDFVRFVDIEFDTPTSLDVDLQAFPIVSSEVKPHGNGGAIGPGGGPVDRPVAATPWYRRWYTVAAFGAVVLVGSAVVFGVVSDGLDFDREKVVGDPQQTQ